MVLDSSAILAILLGEPDRADFTSRLVRADRRVISAATLLETRIVGLARLGDAGLIELDELLRVAAIVSMPFDAEQLVLAFDAFRRYGKGRHPAGLNFGDCFSYALATAIGDGLLFKGDDFSQTDVVQA